MEYIAYLHKDRDSDYGVSFPDFPGCITAGKTLDEASRMAAEALALHIQGMIEDGDAVPEPSKVDDIAADAAKRGAIAFLVSVDAPDATVRVNITARESQMAKIDALAEAAGLTRSGYMVRAAIGAGLFTITIDKINEGYRIVPTNHVAKNLRETELWVRANFQVVPEEWFKLKAQLDSTGKASMQRSAGKVSQGTW
jgi:predicted RNase H-like HicB family nuclease